MKIRNFLSLNAIFMGTIIIITGFMTMFSQVFMDVSTMKLLISFFYTISGIIFWAIGTYLNPEGFNPMKNINRIKSIFNHSEVLSYYDKEFRKNYAIEMNIFENMYLENEGIIEIEFENSEEKQMDKSDEKEIEKSVLI